MTNRNNPKAKKLRKLKILLTLLDFFFSFFFFLKIEQNKRYLSIIFFWHAFRFINFDAGF